MFGFFRCLLPVFWTRYYDELWKHIGVTLGSSTLYVMFGIYRYTSTDIGALFKWDCGLFSRLSHGTSTSPPAEAEDDEDDLAETDIANEEHRALKLSPSDTAIKITHLARKDLSWPPSETRGHRCYDGNGRRYLGFCDQMLSQVHRSQPFLFGGAGVLTAFYPLLYLKEPARRRSFPCLLDNQPQAEDRHLLLATIP